MQQWGRGGDGDTQLIILGPSQQGALQQLGQGPGGLCRCSLSQAGGRCRAWGEKGIGRLCAQIVVTDSFPCSWPGGQRLPGLGETLQVNAQACGILLCRIAKQLGVRGSPHLPCPNRALPCLAESSLGSGSGSQWPLSGWQA